MKRKVYMTLLGSVFLISMSCKTQQAVKVDKARGELEVYSTNDKSSALIDPKKSESYSELIKKVEQKKGKKVTKKEYVNLAQLYLVRGELDRAEKIVRQVLRKDLKNNEARLILANIFYRRGLYDMSSIILTNIGGIKTKNSRVINLMAMIALNKGENSKALAFFREAIKVNPSDVATRMNLGVLFLKYKQINEAAVQFERVLSLVPDHKDAKLHLATVWVNRNQFDKAEDIYKDILSSDEKNQIALYNYAVLQKQTKEYEDAIDNLKQFISLEQGKSNHTDRAFALIDNIRTNMVAEGEEYSNEEIQALAKEIDSRPAANAEVQVAASTPVKETKKPVEGKNKVKTQPKTQTKTAPVSAPVDDDTDSLEQMLME